MLLLHSTVGKLAFTLYTLHPNTYLTASTTCLLPASQQASQPAKLNATQSCSASSLSGTYSTYMRQTGTAGYIVWRTDHGTPMETDYDRLFISHPIDDERWIDYSR